MQKCTIMYLDVIYLNMITNAYNLYKTINVNIVNKEYLILFANLY